MILQDKRRLSEVEFWLLALLLFSLPVTEAGKNIFSLLFFLFWLWLSLRSEVIRFSWGRWDWLIFSVILSSLLSTVMAFDFGHQWRDFSDIFSSLSLAWMLMYSSLSSRQIYILFSMIVGSTFIMSLWGVWEWVILHETIFFELGSVGHTNQSSTYVAMVAGLLYWLILLFYRKIKKPVLMGLLIIWVVLFSIITWGESRATLLAFMVLIVTLSLSYCSFKKVSFRVIGLGFFGGVILFSSFLVMNPYLINKTIQRIDSPEGIDSYRAGIREVSWEIFKHYPVFGIGVSNHGKVNYDSLIKWTGKDQVYWRSKYPKMFDSHSIYLGALAERGVVGFLTFSLLLIAWLLLIVNKKQDMDDLELAVWGCGISVLLVLMINGIFNSSFPYENGRLAFFGLGLMLSVFLNGKAV